MTPSGNRSRHHGVRCTQSPPTHLSRETRKRGMPSRNRDQPRRHTLRQALAEAIEPGNASSARDAAPARQVKTPPALFGTNTILGRENLADKRPVEAPLRGAHPPLPQQDTLVFRPAVFSPTVHLHLVLRKLLLRHPFGRPLSTKPPALPLSARSERIGTTPWA